MSHEHSTHDKAGQSHGGEDGKNIGIAFFLNLTFTLIEIAGGLWNNSVAILSDALHDFGDCITLGAAVLRMRGGNSLNEKVTSRSPRWKRRCRVTTRTPGPSTASGTSSRRTWSCGATPHARKSWKPSDAFTSCSPSTISSTSPSR
jgi:hypothetical protein